MSQCERPLQNYSGQTVFLATFLLPVENLGSDAGRSDSTVSFSY